MTRKSVSLFLFVIVLAISLLSSYDFQVSESASSLVIVGYTQSPFFPLLTNTTIDFLPGETLWVRSNGQATALSDPSGRSVPLSPSTNDPNLLSYSFKNSDPPGNWRLTSGLSSATIILRDVGTSLQATVRYGYTPSHDALLSSGTKASVEAPLFLSSGGGNNSYFPGQQVNFTKNLQALGVGAGQKANISMEYASPIVLNGQAGSETEIVTFTSTVAAVEVLSQNATIVIPQIHQVGTRGLVPLRYGLIRLNVTLSDGTPELQTSAYILPQPVRGSLSSTSSIPSKDLVNNSTFSMVGVNYSGNSLVMNSYKLPLVNFSIFDTHHHVFLETYTLGFPNQGNIVTENIGNNTYAITPSVENILLPTGSSRSNSILLNLSAYNFRVLTNFLVANLSLPQNLIVNVSLERLVLSSMLAPSGELTKSNFTIRTSSATYSDNWTNRTLYLPKGIYNVTVVNNGIRQEKTINLTADASLNFAFEAPLGPYIIGSFIFAAFEIAGLLYLIFIRSRRPHQIINP